MSFKRLLKKGTLGDLRERVSPDRDPSAGSSVQVGDPSALGRYTRVLYITGDARESRITSGAFSDTHPHLDFDFSVELSAARSHLAGTVRHDALVVGWSVPSDEAFSLIGHAREHGYGVPIIAVAEQSLELYRQAGADECVRKGGSFLSRLPVAIEEAVKKRTARPAVAKTFSPGVAALRVAYAGDLDQLRTALEGQAPPLECLSLADTLKDSDLQPGAPPFEIVLIEHGEKSAIAVADVRARTLEIPVVLLVDPADERAAFETFGASIDDYVAKTTDWPTRLQLRLTAARTRYQQTRELASLRIKEARLRSMVEKLPACVIRLSADGIVLATNDRAVSLLGASNANQLLRKTFDVIVDPDGREAWTDFIIRVCAGETRSTEVSVTTLDGVNRVLEAAAVPSPVEFGRSPSVLMVLRDMTDRKRLEAAVEQVTAEPALPDEIETELDFPLQPVVETRVEDAREETRVAVSPAPAARPLRDLEADLHRISGTARSTFQELGTLLRDAETQHDAALSRQADEYARLKAIETEHFQFYEAFVEGAAHGVFRATVDGRLLQLNRALAATLGYDSPSAVLAASDALGVLMDASAWEQSVARWRSESSSEPIDTRWLNRDRQVLTLRLYGRVIESPRGEGECLEVVAENMTAQRSLEAQLRRARRWEDVARVTSGIAADLTYVVAAVSDSTDLDTIQREASKAVALSKQLVAFGRREARDLSALDLNAVTGRMEDVLRRLVDEHIELTLVLAPSLSPVRAAQPPIEEALVNLTVAAADVLPAGGRVRIETAGIVVESPSSQHDGIEPGPYGVISVTATGWGIDARTRERLLSGDGAAEEISKGYASAVRAVGQTGGGLRLDSTGGDSLTFTVYLPQVAAGGRSGSRQCGRRRMEAARRVRGPVIRDSGVATCL